VKALLPLFLISTLAAQVPTQDRTRLETRVPAYVLDASSFIDALIKTASRFEFPLAVEWIKSPAALKPVRFSRNNVSAAAVLDAVVSAQSGYAWQVVNGVVHVFNTATINDPRNPLNILVAEVPDRAWTAKSVDDFLFDSVRDGVRGPGRKIIAGADYDDEPQFHVSARPGLLRDTLDRVITAGRSQIWIATFPAKSALTVKSFWEVTPMYDPKYVKAEDQPLWIFLRWGDPPWKRLETPEP
jgi:hypothetical protein